MRILKLESSTERKPTIERNLRREVEMPYTPRNELARTWAIRLLRLEALIILGLVAYLLIAIFFSHVTHPSALAGEVIFGIAGATGLYVASRGYADRKSYGRAPAVLANGIALGVSYFMFNGNFLIGTIPLLALALPTFFACLFGYSE